MHRTQIYFDDFLYKYLKNESKSEQKSISQVIRDNVIKNINTNKNIMLKNMNNVFGIWKERKIDVENYIDNIRKDRII